MSEHSDGTQHRFFIFETKVAFEKFDSSAHPDNDLYERIEYAILGCNCGEVIKRKIKSEEDTA